MKKPSMNKILKNAKIKRNDEFYTQLIDIEEELKHYENEFENKIVYCNCDDIKFSNFFVYFKENFHKLKLKKLIVSHYSPYSLFEENKPATVTFFDGKTIETKKLKGSGDFRKNESVEFLKQCDIVVTNPPFSLFLEFVELLFQYNKKFLIIGHLTGITLTSVFPRFIKQEMWLGVNNIYDFITPNGIKEVYSLWFTNLKNPKPIRNYKLTEKYEEGKYEYFDNYKNIINVDSSKKIPNDYYGVMAVPISFLERMDYNEFEILDSKDYLKEDTLLKPIRSGVLHDSVNGKLKFVRMCIRRKVKNDKI